MDEVDRDILEYCAHFLSAKFKKYVERLERVPRSATKMSRRAE